MGHGTGSWRSTNGNGAILPGAAAATACSWCAPAADHTRTRGVGWAAFSPLPSSAAGSGPAARAATSRRHWAPSNLIAPTPSIDLGARVRQVGSDGQHPATGHDQVAGVVDRGARADHVDVRLPVPPVPVPTMTSPLVEEVG